MSQFTDVHIGNQLTVSSALPFLNESPILPGRDPINLGIGPSAIPGSIYANGVVLIGNPTSFIIPEIPDAALMVSRPNPVMNPLAAKCIGLFKVSNFGIPPSPPTPLDVQLGDITKGPLDMVGVTVNSLIMTVVNNSTINIASPTTILLTNEFLTGAYVSAGARVKAGAEIRNGVEATTGAETGASVRTQASITTAPLTKAKVAIGKIFTGTALRNKKFDIEHPTKKGHRLSHVCLEGPTSDVYVRGRLKNKNVIELPEYWSGLVDPDSITVSLTPIGKPDLSLHVKEIIENKIILSSDNLIQANCFYHVYGERKDIEKNIPEYVGESPKDYPGDSTHSSIAGYTYDTGGKE